MQRQQPIDQISKLSRLQIQPCNTSAHKEVFHSCRALCQPPNKGRLCLQISMSYFFWNLHQMSYHLTSGCTFTEPSPISPNAMTRNIVSSRDTFRSNNVMDGSIAFHSASHCSDKSIQCVCALIPAQHSLGTRPVHTSAAFLYLETSSSWLDWYLGLQSRETRSVE